MRVIIAVSFIFYFFLVSNNGLGSHLIEAVKCDDCETRTFVADTDPVCGKSLDKTSGVIQYHAGATNLTVTCHIILNISPYTYLNIHLRHRPCASPNQTVSLFVIDPQDDNTPMKQLRTFENKDDDKIYIMNGSVFIISYYNRPEGTVMEQSFVLEFEGRHKNTASDFNYQNFIVSNPTVSLTSPDFEFAPNQFTTWFIHGPIYDNRMISYMYNIGLNFLNLKECPNCVFSVLQFYQDSTLSSISRSQDWVRSFYTSSEYPIRVYEGTFSSIVATLRIGNSSLANPEFLLRWNYLR